MQKWINAPYECERLTYITHVVLSEAYEMEDDDQASEEENEDPQVDTQSIPYFGEDVDVVGSNFEHNSKDM